MLAKVFGFLNDEPSRGARRIFHLPRLGTTSARTRHILELVN